MLLCWLLLLWGVWVFAVSDALAANRSPGGLQGMGDGVRKSLTGTRVFICE